MKLISQGAEARIFHNKDAGIIIKERFRKKYRLRVIDDRLRGSRTRRESKILKKLEEISFPSPRLTNTDDKEKLEMEFLAGDILKNVLEKKDYLKLSEEIGRKIATLHNINIIHSDITTSNMILISDGKTEKGIYIIDFGLSFFSHKIEDMAVDLHLLKEALESKHYKVWEEAFAKVLDGYKQESKQGELVIKRLEIVEKRGRYKKKY